MQNIGKVLLPTVSTIQYIKLSFSSKKEMMNRHMQSSIFSMILESKSESIKIS